MSLNRVNQSDESSNSLLLKSLFAEWPSGNIAQIYSGGNNGDVGHFGAYYEIAPHDRRFGRTFFSIKRNETAHLRHNLAANKGIHSSVVVSWLRRLGSALVLRSGLYELIFPIRISPQMRTFITTFSPELIFAQGYSLEFSRLPLAVQCLAGVPMCFHTSDDWPGSLYKGQALSWLMRPIVERCTARLIEASSLCFGFSPAMCGEYERHYRKRFHLLMIGDNYDRFKQARPIERAEPGTKRIVYAGNVGQGRCRSLVDLCYAIEALRAEDFKLEFYAYLIQPASGVLNMLSQFTFVHLPALPRHAELPAHLKAADLLFLPESFEESEVRKIRLSISSKAHLYMMSERPVLVYADRLAGVTQYALNEGWGLVVDAPEPAKLRGALLRLLREGDLRKRLLQRGIEVAQRHHNQKTNSLSFSTRIRELLNPQQEPHLRTEGFPNKGGGTSEYPPPLQGTAAVHTPL